MLRLIKTLRFALTRRPDLNRYRHLESLVKESDMHRASGVMSSLARGNVLLTAEQVFIRDQSGEIFNEGLPDLK